MGLEAGAIAAIASVAIPALIGVGKELFSGGSGDVTQAGAQKIQDMQKTAAAYGAYRPDAADARMKAMAQQISAYQGAGNMMQAMYGGGGKANMGGYTPGGGGYAKPTIPDLPPPVTGTGGTSSPPYVPPPIGTSLPPRGDPNTGGYDPVSGTWIPPRPPGVPLPDWKNPNPPQTPPPFDPNRPGWGNEPPAFAPTTTNQLAALLAAADTKKKA